MVDIPKTSFIPKQSMGSVPGRAPQRRRHFNVFNFVGMIIFLCGMILAVGVFIYKDMAQRELDAKRTQLEQEKSSFSQGDILGLRALDRRILVAQTLLDQHLAPSVVFEMLEERTQTDVQFVEFSYTRRESGSVELVFDGKAMRFNTVGLQSQQLASAPELASVIFSDVDIDVEDNVNFTITSEADTSELAYSTIGTFDAPDEPMDAPLDTATSTDMGTSGTGGTTQTTQTISTTPAPSSSTGSGTSGAVGGAPTPLPVDTQGVQDFENQFDSGF
jgi:hypothetical protein